MIPTSTALKAQDPDIPGSNGIYNPDDPENVRRCAQEILAVVPHLRRIIQRDREGAEFPITMQQYSVLRALRDQQYLISELADMFKVSRPTMTRIIDGLEGRRRNGEDDLNGGTPRRAKLVERVDSPDDRRLVYARITEEGVDMVQRYRSKAEENAVNFLKRVPQQEIDIVERALSILHRVLEEEE
jgi:DNA-binding MarR family transcriptional regulator